MKLWSLAREWIERRATESSEESVFWGIARKKEQRENGGYGTLFSVVYHRRRTVGEIQLGTASCVPLVHASSYNDTSGGGQATGARRRLAARLDLSQGQELDAAVRRPFHLPRFRLSWSLQSQGRAPSSLVLSLLHQPPSWCGSQKLLPV